jgi:hypothetical protein
MPTIRLEMTPRKLVKACEKLTAWRCAGRFVSRKKNAVAAVGIASTIIAAHEAGKDDRIQRKQPLQAYRTSRLRILRSCHENPLRKSLAGNPTFLAELETTNCISPNRAGLGAFARRLFFQPSRAKLRALRRAILGGIVFGDIVRNTANQLRTHRKGLVPSGHDFSAKGSSS